jgi:hypothetical protein
VDTERVPEAKDSSPAFGGIEPSSHPDWSRGWLVLLEKVTYEKNIEWE